MNSKLFCLALLAPALASAQELGLDLSEELTPAEYRPSVAFIGVTPDAAEEPLAARAKLLEAELMKMLTESQRFNTVKSPLEAAQVTTTARKCTDYACLEALAEKMGVHRIIFAALSKSGPATVLSISGFDPTLPAVLPMQVESGEKAEKAAMGGFSGLAGKSQAQRDKEFLAKVKSPFNEMMKNIATPLGKLVVDVIEQKAVTRLKGKELGTGSFEKALPVGNYELETTSDEYLPFTATVAVEPAKKTEVKVALVAKEIERVVVPVAKVEPAPVFYKRPGLYVTLAGAILMGIGFGLGGMAKSIENRAVDADHDGAIDITRAQASSARTSALLANILVATGAVAFAAGLVWFFIVPNFSSSKPAGPSGPSPSDPAEGSGFGFSAGMGGVF